MRNEWNYFLLSTEVIFETHYRFLFVWGLSLVGSQIASEKKP